MNLAVPRDLQLGVATSSWQIEGDVAGRGRCNWDEFSTRPGAIADGATGEPACDHVHRLEEDLDLLRWLGVDAYRFSISWPRVFPGGERISRSGIGFYDRLVDGLLARGIEPVATLFHWDLPLELEHAGGWEARSTAERFAEYSAAIGERFADRVARWATINEPWCPAFLGYAAGYFAPGRREPGAAFAAAYHLMLAHGLGMQALRAAGARQVGIVLNCTPAVPESPDMAAAARHLDGIQNRLFLDLLAARGIPEDLRRTCSDLTDWSFVRGSDAPIIAAPMDWVGENYYFVMRVARPEEDAGGPPVGQDTAAFPGAPPFVFAPRDPRTEMGWEVVPDGLVQVLRQVSDALPGVPIWVTENGAAVPEETALDGTIRDPIRIDYLERHLAAVLQAREAGVDVRGYFAWSLLDNLEWSSGWTKKFGLVRVDPSSGLRTPKESAHWYRRLIAERGHFRPVA